MAEVTTNFGAGGQGLVPNQGSSNSGPDLATVLRDIILDLTDIQQPSLAAAAPGAALPAFTDPPSAAEMAVLRTRVNELVTLTTEMRTDMIAMGAVTLRSTAP